MHALFTKPVADAATFANLKKDILKDRKDQRTHDRYLLWAAYFYAQFGESSPYLKRLRAKDIEAFPLERALELIRSLPQWDYQVWYYGRRPLDDLLSLLEGIVPTNIQPPPFAIEYMTPQKWSQPRVFAIHYPRVQADVVRTNYDGQLTPHTYLMSLLYNNYYGGGLGSIVFSEIREARALAYSAHSHASFPERAEDPLYFIAYAGTQYDKVPDLLSVMEDIFRHPRAVENVFNSSKEGLKQELASERVSGVETFFFIHTQQKRGFKEDPRAYAYEHIDSVSLNDFMQFFQEHITPMPPTYVVIADPKLVKDDWLKPYGQLKVLDVDEIIPY